MPSTDKYAAMRADLANLTMRQLREVTPRQDGKPTANLAWWCEVRRALGDCRFECKGHCWCEHVRRAHYGSMGETRLRIRR